MLLSLVEYGDPVVWALGGEALRAMHDESLRLKGALKLREEPFAFNRAGTRVQARGVTGFLRLGPVTVEVRPKFLAASESRNWKAALWRVLAAVEENPVTGLGVPVGVTEDEGFSDLLGWVLLDSLRRGRLEGLPRGYGEVEGALPVLRGRLDTSRLVELVIRPDRLPCVYDVYSEDTALNRLLRWAAQTLAASVGSPSLARSLNDEASAFGEVGMLPPGIVEAEGLQLPLGYGDLEPALRVSRLLLRRQALSYHEEEHQAPGFLWNSADVFERFVRYILEQVCRRAGWSLHKPRQILATPEGAGKNITTIPDYLIRKVGRGLLALDAKYKTGAPKSDDAYQVMAVGRLNGCRNVGLLYPTPTPSRASRSWRLRGPGQPERLIAIYVDLLEMESAAGEKRLVNRLGAELRALGRNEANLKT